MATLIERLQKRPGASAIVVVGLAVAAFAANVYGPSGRLSTRGGWIATILILIAGIAVIGATVNGRPAGVLIDNRNRVSLSKFQATLWTVLIISALVAGVGMNFNDHQLSPLEIQIPDELLVAMGISAASLVGTPMLLSLKTDGVSPAPAVARTADKLNLDVTEVKQQGRVFARTDAADASWADMFRGDETSNAGDADLSKVQQFFISLLLVAVYGAAVWKLFGEPGPVSSLPPLSEKFVWLMGISHASYLAYKAAPHGASQPGNGSADPTIESVG